MCLSLIHIWTPEDCEKEAADFQEKKKAELYREYQKELRQNNAMDFDDLLSLIHI